MRKRPLNPRFEAPVLADVKTTTIRDTAWPLGVPVMLYRWSGLPYRSKHVDIAAVEVEATTPIRIGRSDNGLLTFYHAERGIHPGRPLWKCEGFHSPADMDEWFLAKLKPGQTVEKVLMKFRRLP